MITMQREAFAKWYADAQPLIMAHHQEVTWRTITPEMDLLRYYALEAAGQLLLVTARQGSEMLGYVIASVCRHPNYATKCAFEAAHYLCPSARQGLRSPWFRMVRFTRAEAKKMGAGELVIQSNSGKPIGPLFKAMGFKKTAEIYTGVL